MTESLAIDFGDLDDVRAKLPDARRILSRKHSASEAARKDWQVWDGYVKMLELRAGVSDQPEASGDAEAAAESVDRASPEPTDGAPDVPVSASKAAPLDLVVEVVNRENRKIRAQDVAAILQREGHDLAKVAVSNALFYAAKRAKPPRLKQADGRGFYAPLSYQENRFLRDAPSPPAVDLAEIFTGDGDA
jgi:hypothetical protein